MDLARLASHNQYRMESHRALELLTDYYVKLVKSQEKQLLLEIERLIRIFKSRFFQALIDIQEFYAVTLNDSKIPNNFLMSSCQILTDTWKNYKDLYSEPMISDTFNVRQCRTAEDYLNNWTYIEIILSRGTNGLGFSISGGNDNPHTEDDFHIYVTKIISNGVAASDGRLQINDIIEEVNEVSLINVSHGTAVDILKNSGCRVKIKIRRKKSNNNVYKIELSKSKDGFGFSIAGGIGNQHIPGDNSIYITKILDGGPAQIDGRLRVGDKLVSIKNSLGEHNLENAKHEEAVNCLKNAEEIIVLNVFKEVNDQSQSNSTFGSVPNCNNVSSVNYKCIQEGEQLLSDIDQDTKAASAIDNLSFYSSANNSNKSVRTVKLNKTFGGLGFNIVGGEDGEGIFVSSILEGGSAFIDGNLRKGDKIKYVNDINFSNISHKEAANLLKKIERTATLLVEYNEEDYHRFKNNMKYCKLYRTQRDIDLGTIMKTTKKKSIFVRTLFDYDPNKDEDLPSLGLHFHFGEILHVTNASDDEWWLATKILPNSNETFGIIPASKRWERKQRTRDRSVKFEGHMPMLLDKHSNLDRRKKNYSFSRKFPFMKNKDEKTEDSITQESYLLCYTQDDSNMNDSKSKEILYRVELPYMDELTLVYLEKDDDDEDSQQLCEDEHILSYEEVTKIEINYLRPIIILGPIKDRIIDDLISNYPQKFGSCIPHTTRAKRENEVDGKDYHFITSKKQMEQDIQNHHFIEAGQYNDNLYGTSISSVKRVADEGKHCILDVSGNAIKRLYNAQLYPIALFIKIRTPETIMELNKKIDQDQSKKIFYRCMRLEQEFMENFTDVIDGDSYEEIYEKIKESIIRHSGTHIWIPTKYFHN